MKEYRILTHQFWEFKGEKIKSQQILKKKKPKCNSNVARQNNVMN